LYGILAESQPDANTLKAIVEALNNSGSVRILPKGYKGCGQMFSKGVRQLRLFQGLDCNRFIVCYDADGNDPAKRHKDVVDGIIRPSRVGGLCCVVVPVQELEAWILADIEAVTKIFTSWRPDPIGNPESIDDPKECLKKLSRDAKHKPRYSHATHNQQVAKYLDLKKVEAKCESFKPLVNLVRLGKGNCP
jgi:hypothetical protein